MSRIFVFLASLLLAIPAVAQTSKRASFEKAVQQLLTALKKNDNRAFKQFIDAKTGFYLLYRSGVFDQYLHLRSTNLNDHTKYPETNIAYSGSIPSKLNYTTMPVYDCDTDKWTKTGSFADTSGKLTPVSAIAANLVKYDLQKVSKKEMQQLKAIERQSWKVVLANKKGDHCVFYLAWRNKRWVLAVFDTVTTDCSA